jgi:hypothetical protein
VCSEEKSLTKIRYRVIWNNLPTKPVNPSIREGEMTELPLVCSLSFDLTHPCGARLHEKEHIALPHCCHILDPHTEVHMSGLLLALFVEAMNADDSVPGMSTTIPFTSLPPVNF